MSCSRPSRYKDKGVKHCGYCVPCIYRRVAMIEIGLDVRTDYAFSVFDELTSLNTHMQLDFKALVRWAQRVVASTPIEREMVVLSHGSFPLSAGERFGPRAAESYQDWAKMLLRWSKEFLTAVTAASAPAVKKALGIAAARG